MRPSNIAWVVGAVVATIPALVFGYLYYEMYWRWRGCFNEAGRCFDPSDSVVYLEQSGVVYGALFVASLLLPVVVLLAWRRRR